MSKVWEPWTPGVGERVRVRLSAECEAQTFEATPPASIDDDELRAMMQSGVDVANQFATDNWIKGHPPAVDGACGVVTNVDRDMEYGHYYRVMFEQTVEPGAFVGIDLAAIELEPINA